MNVNRLKLTLDNLIYNCIVKKNESVEVILPRGVINQTIFTSKDGKDKSVVISPAEQIELRIFFTIKTATAPDLTITCESKKTKIYGADVKLLPKTYQILSFITSDGGNTWLVKNSEISQTTSDAVTIVNGKPGPTVVLTAEDIKLSQPISEGQQIHSIQEQFQIVDQSFVEMKQTIVNMESTITENVTNEIITLLPTQVETTINNMINNDDFKIIAENI